MSSPRSRSGLIVKPDGRNISTRPYGIPFGREDQTRPLMSAGIGAPALLFDVSGEALLQQRRKARQFVDIDRAAPAGLDHPPGPEQKVVQRVTVQAVRVDGEKGLRRILARVMQ